MFFSQMIKYSISGSIAFLADISILVILTEYAGINYLISAVFAFSVGMFIVYLLSIQWVFDARRIENKKHEFGIFVLIGVIGLAMNELIILIFTEFIDFHYLVSKGFSTLIVYFWNFFNRKYLLFN